MITNNTKLITAVILTLLLLSLGLFLRGPDGQEGSKREVSDPVPPHSPGGEVVETDEPGEAEDEELRLQSMKVAYQRLEQSRRQLLGRLGSLKASTWGLTLPPEPTRRINEALVQVVVLTKNQPMLGAFYDVAGIERELLKIEAGHARLDEVDRILAEVQSTPEVE